jgi:hypothetical protein
LRHERRARGERIVIADTRKGDSPGSVLHIPASGAAMPEVGEAVELQIDWQRRYAHMRAADSQRRQAQQERESRAGRQVKSPVSAHRAPR